MYIYVTTAWVNSACMKAPVNEICSKLTTCDCLLMVNSITMAVYYLPFARYFHVQVTTFVYCILIVDP